MTKEEIHRILRMMEDYMSGKTLVEVGKLHGITSVRVEQLLSKMPQYHFYRKEFRSKEKSSLLTD